MVRLRQDRKNKTAERQHDKIGHAVKESGNGIEGRGQQKILGLCQADHQNDAYDNTDNDLSPCRLCHTGIRLCVPIRSDQRCGRPVRMGGTTPPDGHAQTDHHYTIWAGAWPVERTRFFDRSEPRDYNAPP